MGPKLLWRQNGHNFLQSPDFVNEDKHGDITVSQEPPKSSKSRKTPSRLKEDAIENEEGNIIRKPLLLRY